MHGRPAQHSTCCQNSCWHQLQTVIFQLLVTAFIHVIMHLCAVCSVCSWVQQLLLGVCAHTSSRIVYDTPICAGRHLCHRAQEVAASTEVQITRSSSQVMDDEQGLEGTARYTFMLYDSSSTQSMLMMSLLKASLPILTEVADPAGMLSRQLAAHTLPAYTTQAFVTEQCSPGLFAPHFFKPPRSGHALISSCIKLLLQRLFSLPLSPVRAETSTCIVQGS